MPTINNDAKVSITYDSLLYGQTVMNTFHYNVEDASIGVELTDLYQAIHDELGKLGGIDSLYAAMFTPAMDNIKRRIQVIAPLRYYARVNPSNDPDGTYLAGPAVLPPNVSAALTLRADTAGPHSKGTKHLALTDGAFNENGLVQAAFADLVEPFADAMTVPITLAAPAAGVTLYPVIYNRADHATSQIVSNWSLQPTVRVMRRRTVGLGT